MFSCSGNVCFNVSHHAVIHVVTALLLGFNTAFALCRAHLVRFQVKSPVHLHRNSRATPDGPGHGLAVTLPLSRYARRGSGTIIKWPGSCAALHSGHLRVASR